MIEVQELQRELYKILIAVDEFCRKNEIKYSLSGGSLLGAARHQGFIPWDDDIDICMSRDQYQKFFQCWSRQGIEGFFLQDCETDLQYTQPFAKIRKESSTFIEYEYQKGQKHTGLFVDIFPMDRMCIGLLNKKIDGLEWLVYLWCVKQIGRRYLPCFNRKDRTLPGDGLKRKYRRWFVKKLYNRSGQKALPLAVVEGVKTNCKLFSSSLFDDYTKLKFEENYFPVFSCWDTYLRERYGNYTELPPEKERVWKHHPIVISLDKCYDELLLGETETLSRK